MKWLHRLHSRVMKAHTLQTRFDLVNEASNEGLWDMSVIAGDPINPLQRVLVVQSVPQDAGLQR